MFVSPELSFSSRFESFDGFLAAFGYHHIESAILKESFTSKLIKQLWSYFWLLFLFVLYVLRVFFVLIFLKEDDYVTRYYFGDALGLVGDTGTSRIAIGMIYVIWSLHSLVTLLIIKMEGRKPNKGRCWPRRIDRILLANPDLAKLVSGATYMEKHRTAILISAFSLSVVYGLLEVLFNWQNYKKLLSEINALNKTVPATTGYLWLASGGIFTFVGSLIVLGASLQFLFVCIFLNRLLSRISEKIREKLSRDLSRDFTRDKKSEAVCLMSLKSCQKLVFDLCETIEFANGFYRKYLFNFYTFFVSLFVCATYEVFIARNAPVVKVIFLLFGTGTVLQLILVTYFVGRIPLLSQQLHVALQPVSVMCPEKLLPRVWLFLNRLSNPIGFTYGNLFVITHFTLINVSL